MYEIETRIRAREFERALHMTGRSWRQEWHRTRGPGDKMAVEPIQPPLLLLLGAALRGSRHQAGGCPDAQ